MVSKARLDFPLPLGPVMTVICPSGRSTLMPLRLFCRAPRISMQPHFVGAVTHGLAMTFEPTVKYPRCRVASQILGTKGVMFISVVELHRRCHPERNRGISHALC